MRHRKRGRESCSIGPGTVGIHRPLLRQEPPLHIVAEDVHNEVLVKRHLIITYFIKLFGYSSYSYS